MNFKTREYFSSKRKLPSVERQSPKKTKTFIPLYSCLICDKSFISTEAVNAHMKIIHNSGQYDGFDSWPKQKLKVVLTTAMSDERY